MRRNIWLTILAFFVVVASCTKSDHASSSDTTAEDPSADTGRFVVSPVVLVAVVAPEVDEESGITSRVVTTPDGRIPIFRGDTLYADAAALATAIGVDTAISLDGMRVRLKGRTLDVHGFRARGGVYVPARAFARELGAFTYPERDVQGITVYPRATLEYLLANRERPDEVAVLRGARQQGLLPKGKS